MPIEKGDRSKSVTGCIGRFAGLFGLGPVGVATSTRATTPDLSNDSYYHEGAWESRPSPARGLRAWIQVTDLDRLAGSEADGPFLGWDSSTVAIGTRRRAETTPAPDAIW